MAEGITILIVGIIILIIMIEQYFFNGLKDSNSVGRPSLGLLIASILLIIAGVYTIVYTILIRIEYDF